MLLLLRRDCLRSRGVLGGEQRWIVGGRHVECVLDSRQIVGEESREASSAVMR